jgi:hypothetical protein
MSWGLKLGMEVVRGEGGTVYCVCDNKVGVLVVYEDTGQKSPSSCVTWTETQSANSSKTLLKEKEEEEEALQKKAVGSCQVAQKHRSLFKSIYKL